MCMYHVNATDIRERLFASASKASNRKTLEKEKKADTYLPENSGPLSDCKISSLTEAESI
jgi:hypothetical protein